MVAALGCHAPLEEAVWSSWAFEDAAIASPFQIGWCFLALQITPARWPCQGAPNPRIASACRLCEIEKFFLLLLFRHLNNYFLPSDPAKLRRNHCRRTSRVTSSKKERIQFCKGCNEGDFLAESQNTRELQFFPKPQINFLSMVELLLGFEIERRRKIIICHLSFHAKWWRCLRGELIHLRRCRKIWNLGIDRKVA